MAHAREDFGLSSPSLHPDPRHLPAPQLSGEGSKFKWDVGRIKGQSRNSPSPPEAPLLPTETPPTVARVRGALSKVGDQAFYIRGALNILYFLKELRL